MCERHATRILVLALSVIFLLSQVVHAQERKVSFQSWNYHRRYIRHRQMLGYLEEIPDRLGKKDASFKIVPGLAARCSSLESMNYPGHYLRHQNFRLKLAKYTNEQLFKEDATFCEKRGLAHVQGTSFESVNLPNHYIRHSNFQLWVHRNDGSDLFKRDATYVLTAPGGSIPLAEPQQNPAPN